MNVPLFLEQARAISRVWGLKQFVVEGRQKPIFDIIDLLKIRTAMMVKALAWDTVSLNRNERAKSAETRGRVWTMASSSFPALGPARPGTLSWKEGLI